MFSCNTLISTQTMSRFSRLRSGGDTWEFHLSLLLCIVYIYIYIYIYICVHFFLLINFCFWLVLILLFSRVCYGFTPLQHHASQQYTSQHKKNTKIRLAHPYFSNELLRILPYTRYIRYEFFLTIATYHIHSPNYFPWNKQGFFPKHLKDKSKAKLVFTFYLYNHFNFTKNYDHMVKIMIKERVYFFPSILLWYSSGNHS